MTGFPEARLRIYREDGADLGFVLTCLFGGAIGWEELPRWCDHVIAALPVADVPDYMFELAYFSSGSPAELHRIIGFAPDDGLDRGQVSAIAGIALRRGRAIDEELRSVQAARRALAARPEMLERFRATFPFLADI